MGETQKKGNIGLTKVILNLTENDVSVSIPLSESEKYDLIAEKNNICKTIQVRYSKMVRGSIPVKLRSIWSNGKGRQSRNHQKGDYDIIAIYCPDLNDICYVGDSDFNSASALCVRVDKMSRNNSRSRMFNDCKSINRFFEK